MIPTNKPIATDTNKTTVKEPIKESVKDAIAGWAPMNKQRKKDSVAHVYMEP
jgi:hypothetical protein